MTEYASYEDIIEKAVNDNEEDFTTSTGLLVRVRGLTRAEHLWSSNANDDRLELEARVISKGMVEPKLSREQVKNWQAKGNSKSVSEISEKIGNLSGFFEGADKSSL